MIFLTARHGAWVDNPSILSAAVFQSLSGLWPVELARYRPDEAWRLASCRTWFILGWPAFLSVIVLFFLMVARPI